MCARALARAISRPIHGEVTHIAWAQHSCIGAPSKNLIHTLLYNRTIVLSVQLQRGHRVRLKHSVFQSNRMVEFHEFTWENVPNKLSKRRLNAALDIGNRRVMQGRYALVSVCLVSVCSNFQF